MPPAQSNQALGMIAAIVALSLIAVAGIVALAFAPVTLDRTPYIGAIGFIGLAVGQLVIGLRVEQNSAHIKAQNQFLTDGGIKERVKEAIDEHHQADVARQQSS